VGGCLNLAHRLSQAVSFGFGFICALGKEGEGKGKGTARHPGILLLAFVLVAVRSFSCNEIKNSKESLHTHTFTMTRGRRLGANFGPTARRTK